MITPDDQERSENHGGLDADSQAQLGDKLREAYSDVINQPVPDRFLSLLNQLEASEKKKDKS